MVSPSSIGGGGIVTGRRSHNTTAPIATGSPRPFTSSLTTAGLLARESTLHPPSRLSWSASGLPDASSSLTVAGAAAAATPELGQSFRVPFSSPYGEPSRKTIDGAKRCVNRVEV